MLRRAADARQLRLSALTSETGTVPVASSCEAADSAGDCADGGSCSCSDSPSRWARIRKESLNSVVFVGKFLVLAFVMEALIVLFVPQEWIAAALGPANPLAIPAAALVGLPAYVSNLSALGMIGGLLQKGMLPGAALAFLISGPTTTLPAMFAVFGIASRRVFLLYISLSLGGALAFGFLHWLVGAWSW